MQDMRVNAYLTANSKYFNSSALPTVRDVLTRIPDDAIYQVEAIEYKEPVTMLLFSLFLGSLGVDRFMLGQAGMGVLKLLTAGGCGIWTIVDWFLIQKMTKSANYEKFMTAVSMVSNTARQVVYAADPTPQTDAEAEMLQAKKQDVFGNQNQNN